MKGWWQRRGGGGPGREEAIPVSHRDRVAWRDRLSLTKAVMVGPAATAPGHF